jgi:hypothetical protein
MNHYLQMATEEQEVVLSIKGHKCCLFPPL